MKTRLRIPMWDQMQFFCKHIADHQIRLILHFDSQLNHETLREAVRITLTNNPIVFAQYQEEKKRPFWELAEGNSDKVYSFQEAQEPDVLLREAIRRPIDTSAGPQLYITLIRSATDILVVNCNHVISDAAGVKNFVYQLADSYESLSLGKEVHAPSRTPARSLKILSQNLGFIEKLAVLRQTVKNKMEAPSFQRNLDAEQPLRNEAFTIRDIEPSDFIKIKAFGQKHGATMNDVLLTAFYLTLKHVFDNENKTNRLSYAADLRKFMTEGEYDTLSNFSAIHNIDVDNSADDVVSLLQEIQSKTNPRRQQEYSYADFPVMALLFRMLPYAKLKTVFHKGFDKIKTGKTTAAPSLTNIGIIDERKLNFGGQLPSFAYMMGGLNHPSLFQVAVSTYKNRMTFSIGSHLHGTNADVVSEFLDELIRTCRSMCGNNT